MINNAVTIIMYHYVRDLKRSRYPDIKGLDTALFLEQIKFLEKHYSIISMEMLIDSIERNTALPPKAALLTFDDAYLDHYTNVFPILDEHGIQGSFYVPFKAILKNEVLDVNKIHFILASVEDKNVIVQDIFALLDEYRNDYQLKPNEFYYNELAIGDRFDTATVIFIKRLLQRKLEEGLRRTITDKLFKKYVTSDEAAFSNELYANISQIKTMKNHGMHIGNHSFDHYWLGSLPKENQELEISTSLTHLQELGVSDWTMCYPYGSYNEDTIEILKKYGCKLALATKVGIAQPQLNNRFELPRLDTNDLPKDALALRNEWYEKG